MSALRPDASVCLHPALCGVQRFGERRPPAGPPPTPPDPIVAPSVTLEGGTSTETTLTFTITPADAKVCAYAFQLSKDRAPSAAELFNGKGTTVAADKASPVTVDQLEPGTSYTIYAAAMSGEEISELASLEMTTLTRTVSQVVEVEFTSLKMAYYLGDKYLGGPGEYMVGLKSSYAEDGSYYELLLSLFGDVPQDMNNIQLPAGTFTPADDGASGTYDSGFSNLMISDARGNETHRYFPEGTVEVERQGSMTTLLCDLVDRSGTAYRFTFSGYIPWQDESTPHLEQIDRDVTFAFSAASSTYKGDFYGDGTNFFLVNLNDGNGAEMVLELVTGEVTYSATCLPAGTYSVAAGVGSGPGTINPGSEYNDAGWAFIPKGSYCKTGNAYGFATGGTVTVTLDESTYSIACDLQTYNGHTVEAAYRGPLNIRDGSPTGPKSTLEQNVQVDLSMISAGEIHYWGDFYGNGLDCWILYVEDRTLEGSNAVTLEFLLPANGFDSGRGVPDGQYEISDKLDVNHLVIGSSVDFPDGTSYLNGTWYVGGFHDGGVYTDRAPAASGDVYLGRDGDIYTIDFAFKDDAVEQHAFFGVWSGPVRAVDKTQESAQKQARVSRGAAGR